MVPAPATHVVAVCGSLRETSKTRQALDVTLEAAADAGASTEMVDLREYDLPPLKSDDSVPDADDLKASIAGADSVVLGTPNYHGSYSGVLKNALDYCGRDEFGGSLVGLVEVAAGRFPGPALLHLRQVCRTLNAWTLPNEVAVPRSQSIVTEAGVADEEIAARLQKLGAQLAAFGDVADHREVEVA